MVRPPFGTAKENFIGLRAPRAAGLFVMVAKAVEDNRSPLALWNFSLATRETPCHALPMPERRPPWPHAPLHQLSVRGTYFVSASTYVKAHHFRGKERLRVLHRGLLTVARDFGWHLEDWAVFSNHYRFIGHSPA